MQAHTHVFHPLSDSLHVCCSQNRPDRCKSSHGQLGAPSSLLHQGFSSELCNPRSFLSLWDLPVRSTFQPLRVFYNTGVGKRTGGCCGDCPPAAWFWSFSHCEDQLEKYSHILPVSSRGAGIQPFPGGITLDNPTAVVWRRCCWTPIRHFLYYN